MHRCWDITEVQRAIFREVGQLKNGKATLAHVAGTCRTLNSAALDELWAVLDSFVQLIKCLPRDLWRIDHQKLLFLRPISLQDWTIFLSYSNRIRVLSHFTCISPSLDDDVIYTLCSPPTPGHASLIPNLKVLHWDAPDKKHVPLLHVLLTPTLVALSLSSCTLRYPEILILNSIGSICRSLESFCITWHKNQDVALDANSQKIFFEALSHLRSLKTLSCSAPDKAMLVHVSHLPLLTLSLRLPHDLKPENAKPFIVPPAFTSLSALTLRVPSLTTLTSLLKCMRFKPMTVSFTVENFFSSESLHGFFCALVGACHTNKLLNISFSASHTEIPNLFRPVPTPLSIFTFKPLLALANLKRFEFDTPRDLSLDDNAIKSLTTHWPKLTILSLNAHSGWGIPSGVTYRGSIILLNRCPMLTRFSLAIDFSGVDLKRPTDFGSVRPGGGVSNIHCIAVSVVTSTITYPASIALFLSDVCPNLSQVVSAWRSSSLRTNVNRQHVEKHAKKWDEVDRLLPAFSEARRQSVNWIRQEGSIMSGVDA